MDRNDFASRVMEQTDRMYRIAYVMLRNDEDCRDAMQEAALKAWEKRFTLREPKYFATSTSTSRRKTNTTWNTSMR